MEFLSYFMFLQHLWSFCCSLHVCKENDLGAESWLQGTCCEKWGEDERGKEIFQLIRKKFTKNCFYSFTICKYVLFLSWVLLKTFRMHGKRCLNVIFIVTFKERDGCLEKSEFWYFCLVQSPYWNSWVKLAKEGLVLDLNYFILGPLNIVMPTEMSLYSPRYRSKICLPKSFLRNKAYKKWYIS